MPRELTTELRRDAKAALIFNFARLGIRDKFYALRQSFGVGRPDKAVLEHLGIPDSAMAVQATQWAASLQPGFVQYHGLRSFAFGVALADYHDVRFDREMLYIASILHDISLASSACDGPGSFEVEAASCAHGWLVDRGYDRDKADIIHEAMALHSAVCHTGSRDPEGLLLHLGAGVDVVGMQIMNIHPRVRAKILRDYPRTGFVRDFGKLVADQADTKPNCHIAGLVGVGFAKALASNKLDQGNG
jgi:cyanamide hydratase family protein with HD domain